MDDIGLLAVQRDLSELRRIVDARASLVAGEVAFRSRRELGYAGLAQKEGFQTAEKLIQATTGSTRREATTLVTVGTLVHEAMIETAVDPNTGELLEGFVVHEPWLAAVGAAVAAGSLTVEAARAIRSGLGEPTGVAGSSGAETDGHVITAEALADAVATLLAAASGEGGAGRPGSVGVNADALFQLARQLRDELDEAGIAQRERIIYEQRSFRRIKRPNGCSRYILDGDLETSAWLDDVYDKLISPRRGGPRFIDEADRVWAEAIATDPRSPEQYLHDAIVGLLHYGVDADLAENPTRGGGDANGSGSSSGSGSGSAGEIAGGGANAVDIPGGALRPRRVPRIVGSRVPSVRVLVTEEALRTRTGHGRIEGTETPVSIETVERIICTSGTVPVVFGTGGNVLNLGREQRLYSTRQKAALAARDGGCIWECCDSPASWTEAHHIKHWARDHGNTDLADGVLLCRHHHLLLHNNHWEIIRKGNSYWLIPPPDIDPAQKPRPLPSKSAALRDLQHERKRADLRAS
ncbi:hypothetical protein BKA04_002048 [Cryobacterium mesophilum]|nr:DUF222 domain-containing protein [Terrimesophilobacter mesophilus]MBB5633825.1 hypothetical protein [Terrimesophilobacter mesophilus]